ncbi:MAG: histidine kinase [Lachnospiraceae bacterium]|mgnify:CR=1 FL=1|nr:histidine kinase [Lachnospiraceae bacterium]MCI9589983.1 histidine kinase [Lachnospiraceae bacterium]
MKRLIKRIKYRFYQQSITKRIIIVITIVSILSNMAFVGSVFIIMRNQLFNKTKAENEKDIQMIENELEMFFNGVRQDAVSVLVSNSCQILLSESEDFLSSDTTVQYRKYKLMQSTIMSTIGQRTEYNTIAFYDRKGNCYADDRLIESQEYLSEQQERIWEFLNSDENEMVLNIHRSPWRKKKENEFRDCLSYLRKVYNKEQGQLIGVVELEILNEAVAELYRPVMENGSAIYLVNQDRVISSADMDMLYKELQEEEWYVNLNQAPKQREVGILKDRKHIYFLKNYPELGWKIIDRVPTAIYMRDVKLYAFIDIMIGILLFFGNLYLSRMLIASITKPLSKITDTIVEIGQGDYEQRVHVKDGGEIGTLAQEFNRMVEKTKLLMEQNMKKEQEKRESDLSLIQMQMTPHFFYNILESICGLIVIDEKRTAIRTISLLSGFYRGVLNKGKEIVPLERELDIAVNYLEIMKICHPGKFLYVIDCPDSIKQNCINKLTLQPILENAIHHGFNQMESGGLIRITGTIEAQKVVLEISDNGRGMKMDMREVLEREEAFHMESFGLGNTNERIKLYFGDEYGLSIASQEIGTKIRIELPLQQAEESVRRR